MRFYIAGGLKLSLVVQGQSHLCIHFVNRKNNVFLVFLAAMSQSKLITDRLTYENSVKHDGSPTEIIELKVNYIILKRCSDIYRVHIVSL